MLSAWLLLPALAITSQTPPPAEDPIVVTGTQTTRDAIARYVERITAEFDGQIATFRQPICPASVGLPDGYNRVIEGRLREVATQIGLRIAQDTCDPNLVVIVADNSDSLVDQLRKQRADIFSGVDFARLRAVIDAKGPVRTWQAIEQRGADGRPLELISFFQGGGDVLTLRGTTALSSRIARPVRQDLVTSFVMLDVDAIDGLTLTQIADYAAMRAFARTQTPSAVSGQSILGLFDAGSGNARAGQLTRWDLAYLRALYATNNSLAANVQQSAIAAAIRQELDRPAER